MDVHASTQDGGDGGEADCAVVMDKMLAYTVIPYIVFFVSYWTLSAFFTLCDRLLLRLSSSSSTTTTTTTQQRWLDRFKIQEGLDEERLRFGWRHLLHVLALQILVSIPIGLALSPFWPDYERVVVCPPPSSLSSRLSSAAAGVLPHDQHDLTLTRFAFEFIAILILFEIFFYYSHLTLHRPFFYKRIHKMHHHYTGTATRHPSFFAAN
jgi:sterol desaturase/sphingolipid hydroxylase (fatty acid hydroxylase superfamily)